MNTKDIIQENLRESDQLMLKIFRTIPLFIMADVLFILVLKKFNLEISDWLIASTAVVCFIPLIYYKKSEDKKHFFWISIICTEWITSLIYITSWYYGALLLGISLLVCVIYLDTKSMKRLLIAKVPLTLLINITTFYINRDYTFAATHREFISSSIYFVLQIVIIGYLCGYIAKKTNNVFETFIKQNDELDILLQNNRQSTEKINETINNLSHNIGKSSEGVELITQSSSTISNKAQNMSDKAYESKVAFETITSQIQDNSKQSSEIFELTREMNTLTIKNQENMQALVQQMNELKLENQKSQETFKGLQASTEEISVALKIINAVSEETDLIALNASIEAAKAGETGKSFAVVAAEIKKLATQTANSVQYIEKVIDKVGTSMQTSVSAMNNTDEMLKQNVEKLSVTLQDFDKMATFQETVSQKISDSEKSIQALRSHVIEVDEKMNETMLDSKETSENISEISAVLEEISAALQEITSDAKEVQEHSNRLVNVRD